MARLNRGQDDSNGNYDDLVRQSVMDEMDPAGGQQAAQFPNLVGGTINTNPSGDVTGVTKPGDATETPWSDLYPKPASQSTPAAAPPSAPPPPPSPGTQASSPSVAPAPAPVTSPGQATSIAPPQASSSLNLPPELSQILNQLRSGLSSFQAPQVSQPSQVTPAYADLLRNSIMQAIQEGQQPVNASDPMVAPIIQALASQSQRSKEANQGRVAEQLSARHLLNSGAYDTSVERYNQGVDEAASNSTAQVMTQVLGQRQQRLMQAIQLGANYLTADQARQLQAELANVNSALAQYQVKGSLGLNLLQALLQNQFGYDQLGLQAGEFSQLQNNNATSF